MVPAVFASMHFNLFHSMDLICLLFILLLLFFFISSVLFAFGQKDETEEASR